MNIQLGDECAVAPAPSSGNRIALARTWQISSGICQPQGGVARSYLPAEKRFGPVSYQTSAYLVSSLLRSFDASSDQRCLDVVGREADHLANAAWHSAASTFLVEPIAPAQEAFTRFSDCGIILRALVQAWQSRNQTLYLRRAIQAASSMWDHFVRPETIHAVLRLQMKAPVQSTNHWSNEGGCYQLKAALGWKELGDATGTDVFYDYYAEVLDRSLASHGDFLVPEAEGAVAADRLHGYCYFLEGLFPAIVDGLRHMECLEALAFGVRHVGRELRRIPPECLRSDLCAQILRIRLCAAALGISDFDHGSAMEEMALVKQFQELQGEPRVCGGFYLQMEEVPAKLVIDPIATAFCLQALSMWEEYMTGTLNPEPHKLI